MQGTMIICPCYRNACRVEYGAGKAAMITNGANKLVTKGDCRQCICGANGKLNDMDRILREVSRHKPHACRGFSICTLTHRSLGNVEGA